MSPVLRKLRPRAAWRQATLLLLLVTASTSGAETHCRPIAGGTEALTFIGAETRLHFIQGRLRHGARRARIWSWTWAGVYSASAVINFGLAISADDDSRPGRYVGAGASLVGVASLAALPLKVMRDQRWLDRRIASAPADTDPCALLADAERLLLRGAASEAFGRGPLVHVGTFLFNTGIALILTLGYNRAEEGMIAAFIGLAVGELQIATQPVDVIHDLRRYRAGDLSVPTSRPALGWSILPDISRNQGGVRLTLAF